MEQTERPQVHRVHWFWLLLEGLLLLVGLPVGAFFLLYRQVRPVTVWEMTGSCPPASALMKDGGEASYAFDTAGRVHRGPYGRPAGGRVLRAGADLP